MRSKTICSVVACAFVFLFLPITFANAQSQFAAPPNGQSRLIVFVHGLGNDGGDDPLSAWSTGRRGADSWPALMQGDETFRKNFAIFVYQYRTSRFTGNFHVQALSDELKLRIHSEAKLDNYAEVYFIAHSLGGIVVRNYLIKDEEVRKKTKAIFLFASPMGGSSIAAIADRFGLASVQTAQLGKDPQDPDAVFNTIKDNWYKDRMSVPSYCAYETETTAGQIIVRRASVEPLCSNDVQPLRGNHTGIITPIEGTTFEAHELLRGWLTELLPDFENAARASETENKVVIANCNGNQAYRGPYGRVHKRLKDVLSDNGISDVRYSLPLTQVWVPERSRSAIYKETQPTHVVIHLSCFQNTQQDNDFSIENRDRNFIEFLRSFKDNSTRIVVYSRAFKGNGCGFLERKVDKAGLADAYRGRLFMIAINDREVPGDGGPGDRYLSDAFEKSKGVSQKNECFGAVRT